MRRADWYLGVLLVTLALVWQAANARYEWRPWGQSARTWIRFDRWTGSGVAGMFNDGGRWIPLSAAPSHAWLLVGLGVALVGVVAVALWWRRRRARAATR